MKILALDPSVNFVGWAIFDSKKRNVKNRWKWGYIRLEGNNYQMRLAHMIYELHTLVDLDSIKHVVLEWPTFFSSEKGHIAAHQNYTIDLAGVCCFLAGWLQLDHRHWHVLTASTWKGMVSKWVTGRKFFRVFGIQADHVSEHAIDATMMLHYWLKNYGRASFQRDSVAFPECALLRL